MNVDHVERDIGIGMADKIDWSSIFNQFDKLAEQVKQLDDNIDRFNNATKERI